MWLKKLDWLSPPITLFYKGEGSHVSIYSGILSIVAYTIVVVATFYYALNFINRQDPKAYFFNRYIEDAGTFPLNASLMFNFIQVSDPTTNKKVPLDFGALRIVGFDDVYAGDYKENKSLVKYKDHWIYGKCNNDTDTEGIGYLIDQDYYTESACIRKYYNKDEKKYYETGEEGFRWPVLLKGCSNPARTYYGIIIEKCANSDQFLKDNGGTECKSNDEANDYLKGVSLNFQIIDHYADMLNYDMPFTKYFYEVTSAISNQSFIIQHLNFNPASMLTHNGYFFDNQVEEKAYFFIHNEKQTDEDKINGCIIGIYFWMQNTLQYYERTYDRIQDILSDIGGISSIVLTIAGILNLLIHNFIVILDTEDFALNTEQENYDSRELSRRPTIFKKANEVMYPPRRPYQARKQAYGKDPQQQQSSNYQRLMKDGVDIYPNMNSRDEKSEQFKNLYVKRNNLVNRNKEGSKDSSYQQGNSGGYSGYGGGKGHSNRGNYRQGGDNYNTMARNLKDENTTEKKDDFENRPLEKQNFNWCKFLGYLICCGRTDQKMKYYEEFRAKLISEDNIIQNYLDTYKLLKHCNLKKTVLNKEE